MNDQRLSVEHGTTPSLVLRLLAEEDGVTAIEYGLLASLIVVAAVGGITATGTSIGALYVTWTSAVIAAL